MTKKCILICAGECIPTDMETIKEEKDGYIIAVDGGYDFCKMYDIKPDCLVGDLDSVDEGLIDEISALETSGKTEVHRFNPVKDDTDTLAALKIGMEKGFLEFHIYCAMGGRMDHSIANMQTLLFLAKRGARGFIHVAEGYIVAISNESIVLPYKSTGYISVFTMNGVAKGVTIKNLKYTLDDGMITSDIPIGCSNEFIDKKDAFIEVKDGDLIICVN